MYIFEGRGKGATTALLLEALHNQGVYVTAIENTGRLNSIKRDTLEYMVKEQMISRDGQAYLEESVYTLSQWNDYRNENAYHRRRQGAPVYLDNAMWLLNEAITEKIGSGTEVIALSNNDNQVVHPRQIKEMNNTFVQEGREYFGRE